MHISKLQKLWLELREESLRIDKCELPTKLLIMRILRTLPDDYFKFRTTRKCVPRDQRSVENLLERLKMVETRLEQRQEATQSSSISALVAERHKSGSKSGTNKKSDNTQSKATKKKEYSKMKCYSCGKIGNIQFTCLKKKEDCELAESNWKVKKDAALLGVALVTGAIDGDA